MKRSDICIGFVPIARPTFDLELARQLTDLVFLTLKADGYQLVGSQELIMDGAAMDTLMGEGLEHHVSITCGDYQEVLVSLAGLLGLSVLRL